MAYHKINKPDNRKCVFCGSTKTMTFTHHIYKKKYPRWYLVDQKYCCNKCYQRRRADEIREKGMMSFHEFYALNQILEQKKR